MKKIVAGNWKMYGDIQKSLSLTQEIHELADGIGEVTKIIFPSFIPIYPIANLLRKSSIQLGAQDIHWELEGAYTGEVSIIHLRDLCKYILIGHTERREYFGETNAVIRQKIETAIKAGFTVILAIGENSIQKKNGKTHYILEKQLTTALERLAFSSGQLVIAYEPVWAIGTGVSANPTEISEIINNIIKPILASILDSNITKTIPILYGGSVNPDNVYDFAKQEAIQGALVGGASLDGKSFAQIIQAFKRT